MHSYIYILYYLSVLFSHSITGHDDISLSIQCSVNHSHRIILVEKNYDICNKIMNDA